MAFCYMICARIDSRSTLNETQRRITKPCIGLDVGRSAVKIVAHGDAGRIQMDFPSAVCRAERLLDDSAAALAATETVSVDGKEFFVGRTAMIQGRETMIGGLSDNWANLPQHAALLLSGIKRLAGAGVPNAESGLLVVGLPARLYSSQRKTYAAQVAEFLPRAEIKVVPQSMGPYYSLALDEHGVDNNEGGEASWAFIEVGQFTTDFAMVQRGHVVDRMFDSCDGMRVAAERLQRLVLEKHGARIDLAEASDILASRRLTMFGTEHDVSALVAESCVDLANTVADKAGQLFGDQVRTLRGVRIAGGGAPLIRDAVERKWTEMAPGGLPPSFVAVADNARFAVAEGFCRFAMGLEYHRAAMAA